MHGVVPQAAANDVDAEDGPGLKAKNKVAGLIIRNSS